MAYTVTTHESWGKRLGNALSLVVVGLLMLVGGIFLLFWNEGRAVKTAQALEEGESLVVSVSDPAQVDAANEGKLVHLSGCAATEAVLKDGEFGLCVPAMRLIRSVEYYQWVEHEDTHSEINAGGSSTTTTTYSYEKKWCDEPVASSRFHELGHENRVAYYPVGGDQQWLADPVTLGGYRLSAGQVRRVGRAQEIGPDEFIKEEGAAGKRVLWQGGYAYIGFAEDAPPGADIAVSPPVGAVRVSWAAVPQEQAVSLVAQQSGTGFVPYVAKSSGYEVDLLEDGLMTAEQMFAKAHKDNTVMTWLLRVAGSLLTYFGLLAMLHVVRVAGDVIPFLGSLLGGVTAVAALPVAFFLSVGTMAVAWAWYRPALFIALGVLALVPLLWRQWRKRRAA